MLCHFDLIPFADSRVRNLVKKLNVSRKQLSETFLYHELTPDGFDGNAFVIVLQQSVIRFVHFTHTAFT